MKRQPIRLKQTNKVKAYNGAATRATKINHVVKHSNGWAVKKSGSSRASAVYNNQGTAINKATNMAKSDKGGVVVHNRHGRIRDVKRYY